MNKFFLKIFCFTTIILSQEWASQSGGFLRMGLTARSIAMGGGYTAELDQGFPNFHNPAWSAFLIKKHFGSSYSNLTLDRRLASTSIAFSIPPTAGIGLAWVYSGVSNIQGRYSSGMKSTKMQTGENAIIITFAQRIVPWLSIGANFKILRYDLPITQSDQISGTGLGFDIGLLVKTGGSTSLGIMIQDLSSNYQWDTNAIYAQGGPYKESFPTIFRIGSRFYKNDLLVVGDVGLITDINRNRRPTYLGIIPRLGVEYSFLEQYFFRGGYGNGRISFGFGYEYGLFKSKDSKIDYSFSLDWVSQSAHTISYAYSF